MTTLAVDEGRHAELFTRYYSRLDREPMSIRRFPAGYLFQGQIMSTDVAEWLYGVIGVAVLAQMAQAPILPGDFPLRVTADCPASEDRRTMVL